jgi:hypothetical protein
MNLWRLKNHHKLCIWSSFCVRLSLSGRLWCLPSRRCIEYKHSLSHIGSLLKLQTQNEPHIKLLNSSPLLFLMLRCCSLWAAAHMPGIISLTRSRSLRPSLNPCACCAWHRTNTAQYLRSSQCSSYMETTSFLFQGISPVLNACSALLILGQAAMHCFCC